jgi:hypothetical protein
LLIGIYYNIVCDRKGGCVITNFSFRDDGDLTKYGSQFHPIPYPLPLKWEGEQIIVIIKPPPFRGEVWRGVK